MRTRSSKNLFCCAVMEFPAGMSGYAQYLVNGIARLPRSYTVYSRDSNGAAKKFLTALKNAVGDYADEVIRPGLVVGIWSDFKSWPEYKLNSDLKLVRVE